MLLNTEEFKIKEALAQMNIELAQGKAKLQAIKADEAKLIENIEKKALAKVNSSLSATQRALREVENYQEEFNDVKKLITANLSILTDISTSLKELFDAKELEWEDKTKKLDEMTVDIEVKSRLLKESSAYVKKDREALENQQESLKNFQKKIFSQSETIKLGLKELTKKL